VFLKLFEFLKNLNYFFIFLYYFDIMIKNKILKNIYYINVYPN
jgi:hypothetical protein